MNDAIKGIRLYKGLSLSIKRKFTKEDIVAFSKLTGDFNKLHLDEKEVEKTRFKHPICQGFLTGSLFSNIMGNNFPMSIYLSQSMNFKAPVYIDEEVTAEIVVKEIKNKVVKLKTIVYKENRNKAIDGEAFLLIENINQYI